MSDRGDPSPSRETELPLAGGASIALEAHLERLYAYAYRLAGSHDLAEELTQQTFLVAHQQWHQLRDLDRLGGWLLRILRNTFLKSRRRRRPVAASQVDVNLESVLAADASGGSDCDEEAIRLALDRLPDEFRVVVLMFYFEQLSYQEIASELEIPVGTVMSRLSRARAALRRVLATPEKMASG